MPVASSFLLIGRDAELARLETGLALVPCAVILGLPGVGKSALARQLAASWPRPVYVHHASDGGSLAGLIDDLRRELGVGAAPPLAPEPERFAELAGHLERGGHLWLIEDADRIDGIDRLVTALSLRLGRARVIVTARGRIFAADRDPERVELVLDGLDEPAARQLWQHLDTLYGPAPEFEAAWRHAAGNPFLLRQAHAGVTDRDDPAAAAIATLAGEPRQLALALALATEPVHRSVLVELSPGRGAGEALRVLLRRLIIEPAGDGRFAVHDLLRGALLRDADADAVRAMHARLAAALEHAPLDPVVRVRERARHLLGADRRAAARTLVLASAQALIRAGAATELLRLLDAFGDAPDAEIQFARARTLVRMLDLHRAYDQMIALGADGRAASDEMRATLAHVAMLTGRLELAARVSHAALASRTLAPALRVRLSTVQVLTRTAMGDGEDARAATCGPAAEGASELVRAYLEFTRAFSLWLEERDAEAEDVMRRAWALCRGVLSFRARVLAPLFFASVLARTGNLAESEQVLSEVESDVADFEDPLVGVSQRIIRATWLESRGAFDEALQLIGQVEATYHQAGHVLGLLWARVYRGRLLLLTGRVRAGRACLDELARAAGEIGARVIVRLARDALRADPLQALAHGPAASARPGEARRGSVIAAIQAAIEGRLEIARGYVVALEVDGKLDPLSRALLGVVRARLAPPAEHAQRYEEALTQAAAAGADPELIPAIAARAGLCPGATAGPPGVAIVIDTVHHELRCEDRVVALSRRPSVRRLLYTLAADLGRAHDKASLTRGIWNASYKPERHDGALWVNVKRLREILQGTGLRVDSGDDGYRLRVDDGHVLRTAGE
ncbi:MAG TPA: AAA family ATPase [Kofleriaceae bacterium]